MVKYCLNVLGPVLLRGEQASTIPRACETWTGQNKGRRKTKTNTQASKAGGGGCRKRGQELGVPPNTENQTQVIKREKWHPKPRAGR